MPSGFSPPASSSPASTTAPDASGTQVRPVREPTQPLRTSSNTGTGNATILAIPPTHADTREVTREVGPLATPPAPSVSTDIARPAPPSSAVWGLSAMPPVPASTHPASTGQAAFPPQPVQGSSLPDSPLPAVPDTAESPPAPASPAAPPTGGKAPDLQPLAPATQGATASTAPPAASPPVPVGEGLPPAGTANTPEPGLTAPPPAPAAPPQAPPAKASPDAPQQAALLPGDENLSLGDAQQIALPGLPGEARSAPAPQAPAAPPPSPPPPVPPVFIRAVVEAAQQLPDRPVEISLAPEELGPVRLTLSLGDDGLSIAIAAERPETLQLFRRHAEALALQFRDFGYGNPSFTFSGGMTFAGGGHGHPSAASAPGTSAPPAPPPQSPPAAGSPVALRLGSGIDIRL